MKEKSNVPIWFWGVALIVGAITGQSILPYLGIILTKSTLTVIIIIGAAIAILDLYSILKRGDVEKFFIKAGLINAPKIKKETKPHGYDIYLRLPMGKCLSDFKKYTEPLEQFLDNQVEMKYDSKRIIVSVSDKKPVY